MFTVQVVVPLGFGAHDEAALAVMEDRPSMASIETVAATVSSLLIGPSWEVSGRRLANST